MVLCGWNPTSLVGNKNKLEDRFTFCKKNKFILYKIFLEALVVLSLPLLL
jgi:hypothetical protein